MTTSDEHLAVLDHLLRRVRSAASDMEYEEGSGRCDTEPRERFDATLAEIRTLFVDTLTDPAT